MRMPPPPPADRPSRLQLFMRRQKKTLRPVAGLFLVGILAGGGFLYLSSPQTKSHLSSWLQHIASKAPLHIVSIKTDGAQLTSPEAISEALGVHVGDPILAFSVSGARDRLNKLPFVDHVIVERHLAGDIVVHITERPPFAVWQHNRHFILIDRQGNPVPDQGMTGKDAEAFTKLPLVVGVGASEAAASLIDVLSKEPEIRSHVAAAVRVNERRWNLVLHNNITVLLPEGEEELAIHRLASIQKSTHLLDRSIVSVDMRLPDRLTVTKQQSEPGLSGTSSSPPPEHTP
ncbi:cell division protein FtsQ/DivIB [Acetobacter thailandicus]|uniref:cell division protein FtsQ/DivIB n=1 Tax=Acetobacter thailandicus TaxID=1502842 RepID=UPI001BAE46A2|nr:cell division protein FtsQ/DivIB [Acetobacter thailandicus]MBS1003569.1 cell division protein FtsQ/DivIB [Acetobacter thailandicus]